MLLGVGQVGFNQFWRMSGIVDLDAVEWNLSADLIEQMRGIKRKFILALTTPRMGYECDSATPMNGLYRLRNICLEFLIACVTNQFQRGRPVTYIAMFDQQR